MDILRLPALDQLEFTCLRGGDGQNLLVSHGGRPLAVYKPRPGTTAVRNEVAAWAADGVLGLRIVPYTRAWFGPRGLGSLQEYVPHHRPGIVSNPLDRQRIAVFDYIMASGDRHAGNMLRRAEGGAAAIDNADILPEQLANRANLMRSVFVAEVLGVPLDPLLLDHLGAVRGARLSGRLRALGFSPLVSEWAAARLREIQREGRITGAAWGCAIMNELEIVYPVGYASVIGYWADHPPADQESPN